MDPVDEAWHSHRAYLVNLAYQMLGDIGEAEDAVQEAFLRLSRTDPAEIDQVRAWLSVVTGRLCLDQLRSARSRREYPAEVGQLEAAVPTAAGERLDPAQRVTLDDEVRGAMLLVLGRLSPAERVAFVLHDVFEVPFDEIAETVGRPVGTCRQLARRARIKFRASAPGKSGVNEVDQSEHRLVTERFIEACATGDVEALAATLDPDVWGVGTVLADPPLPPQTNYGATDVATNLLRYLGPGATVVHAPGGESVLLAYSNRRLFAVVTLTIRAGLVLKIEATADPSALV